MRLFFACIDIEIVTAACVTIVNAYGWDMDKIKRLNVDYEDMFSLFFWEDCAKEKIKKIGSILG